MTQKEQFLQAWQNEAPTTLKVLKAYPAEKANLQPHERSQTAIVLAWNLVLGPIAIQQVLDGKFKLPPDFPPAPGTWQELIAAYQLQQEKLGEKLKGIQESDLPQTVKFPAGPGDMRDMPIFQVLWFIFCDNIHHRGQLSVYLRMAGGKVPSIYGPSADEPWF